MITLCCVDAFIYDKKSGELGLHGAGVRLEPKAAEVLNLLISKRGQLLLREDILQAIWPDRVVVEEVLTRVIGLIRKGFGDTQPYRFVETLPKRGYRFVATISALPEYPDAVIIEPRSSSNWGDALSLARSSTRTDPEGVMRYSGASST